MTIIDERFLMHRLRSTSVAFLAGGVLATLLWFYRYVFEHRFDGALFAVAVTMAAIKQGLMLWYRFTD